MPRKPLRPDEAALGYRPILQHGSQRGCKPAAVSVLEIFWNLREHDMSGETGKCWKARRTLDALKAQRKALQKQLTAAQCMLRPIVMGTILNVGDDMRRLVFSPHEPNEPNEPPEFPEIMFFIDFRILSDGEELEGAIVYGAFRQPCYPHRLILACSKNETKGGGAAKSDTSRMEEKPLLYFSVNEHGRITGRGKVTDEWWLPNEKERDDATAKEAAKKSLREMHFRTLACIYHDALNWINEPFLP